MLQEFNHINFGRMRVIIIDGKPWFLAVDSYKITGVDSRWIRYAVNKADVSRVDRHTIGIKGKCSQLIIINERGICSFVRKFAGKNASPYIHWLHEIAQQCTVDEQTTPTLSDNAQLLERIIANPDFGIALLKEIKAGRERIAALEAQMDADSNKAQSMDTIVGEFSKWLNSGYGKLSA